MRHTLILATKPTHAINHCRKHTTRKNETLHKLKNDTGTHRGAHFYVRYKKSPKSFAFLKKMPNFAESIIREHQIKK